MQKPWEQEFLFGTEETKAIMPYTTYICEAECILVTSVFHGFGENDKSETREQSEKIETLVFNKQKNIWRNGENFRRR